MSILVHVKNKMRDQFLYILFFMMVFSLVGYLIPRFYFQFVDKTVYYEIRLPIRMEEREHRACDFAKVIVERKALVDISASGIVELRSIRDDGSGVRDIVDKQFRELTILKSENNSFNVVTSRWVIPCNTEKGRYVFEGMITYEVNGIKKYTPLKTEEFIIR